MLLRHSLLALPLLATLACGDKTPDCPEPLFRSRATDEAWLAMVDGKTRATYSPSQSPALTEPTAGAVYSPAASPLPTFRWTSALHAHYVPKPRGPSLWKLASSLLIPSAEAHLPPVTSDLYLLEFTLPNQRCPLAVVTSELSWPVEQEYWTQFAAAGAAGVTLQIYSAYLEQNRVREGAFVLESERRFEVR